MESSVYLQSALSWFGFLQRSTLVIFGLPVSGLRSTSQNNDIYFTLMCAVRIITLITTQKFDIIRNGKKKKEVSHAHQGCILFIYLLFFRTKYSYNILIHFEITF